MIDLLFSTSAGGCLEVAQNFGKGRYQEGQAGVVCACPEGAGPTAEEAASLQRREEERTTPLAGSAADVYVLDLALSLGDISELEPGLVRLRVQPGVRFTRGSGIGTSPRKSPCPPHCSAAARTTGGCCNGRTLRCGRC